MPVTVGTIRSRIRSQLNEATQRFYPDSAASGLVGWWCDGAAQQHRIVLEQARQAKRTGDLYNTYLRYFAKMFSINVVEGTQLYALPADFLMPIRVGIANQAGESEKDACMVGTEEDWFVRNVPQMGPTFERPAWSLQLNPSTGATMLQVFVFGSKTVPNAPMVARMYYLRDFVRTVDLNPNANVDLDDPYCEGPVWYAVAQAMLKRGSDPTGFLSLADRAAQNILGSMAASDATTGAKEAEGLAMQVEMGRRRDAR